MIRQFELIEKVRAYNPGVNEDLLNRAYVYGVVAHGGQTRKSGEPYFNHPVEVAAILTGLRLDEATIAAALLHDTIEDTPTTYEDLERRFGEEVARLVDGVTKLSKLKLVSKREQQAENLRKLLVSMARDPRVLLVKMADRLHNMRTVHHLPIEKRERICRETLEIYAPLAGRMGMQWMREELEDLAFAVLRPDARLSVMRRFVHLKHTTGDGLVPEIIAELETRLARDGVAADVFGREKRPYAIWRKMQEKSVSFEQLSDIIAFRILVDTEDECYRALGAVHQAYRAVPGRFKDYVSGPKPNGYRSIHTTVIGPHGARIEMQIRTYAMHEVAESGVAAHWSYRDGVRNLNQFAVDPFDWLRELVARLERGVELDEAPEEFLEDARLEMSFDQVFCFTPKGDVISLPQGATALDFAYAIHTDVGNSAVGARVNGKRAPLWTPVRNGHTVEILQSKGQEPQPIWREFVKTGRARAAIRRTLRAQKQRQAAKLGRRIVERCFEIAGAPFTDRALDDAATSLGEPDGEALLAGVGEARLTARAILEAAHPELAAAQDSVFGAGPETDLVLGGGDRGPPEVVVRAGDVAGGAAAGDRLWIPSASCCRPLPGERVVALSEPGRGFRLHAINCATLERYEDDMDRWLDVAWPPDDANAGTLHLSTILLTLSNEPGALGKICTVIGAAGCNIDLLEMTDRTVDFFRMKIDVEVRDIRHLSTLLNALRAQPAVAEATRVTAETSAETARDANEDDEEGDADDVAPGNFDDNRGGAGRQQDDDDGGARETDTARLVDCAPPPLDAAVERTVDRVSRTLTDKPALDA